MQLTQNQIDFFQHEGYLTPPSITTEEELKQIRAIYDHLFAERAGREEGNQFDLAGADEEGTRATLPQILNPPRYAPELNEFLFKKNAKSIADQLLGDESTGGDHAILKPAHYGSETPWHQDEAYWNPDFNYRSLSIWMPLQDATIESGCMQFVPRSHKQGVLNHHPINNDPRVHGLEVDHFDESQIVSCPIPAGGVTIHHCRTLHYAGPNSTGEPRRAYIQVFGLPTSKREETRNFYWQRMQRTARAERSKASMNSTGATMQ
ncbi:phytanoyl-CoA dioxygenase family protein [Chloroflexi bacterium TSY]|nr:phytanoyl-CoA dioxygenase family protein [Chloroflexi bacterium TSY]